MSSEFTVICSAISSNQLMLNALVVVLSSLVARSAASPVFDLQHTRHSRKAELKRVPICYFKTVCYFPLPKHSLDRRS
ncbi:unnamed protein product [Plutella xylostella]|uniref:(diamondback moth) hypothetical protein n=1 Tax=Plutella xylostella TaxID=51655 RepID=A0A8S4G4B2_PLUXY|nr:unnamed protein product [Plutella xylostella]